MIPAVISEATRRRLQRALDLEHASLTDEAQQARAGDHAAALASAEAGLALWDGVPRDDGGSPTRPAGCAAARPANW